MIYGDSTHQNHHFSFYVSILLGILTKKSYFFNQKNIAFIVLNVNTQKKVLKTPCIISKYIVQYTSNLDCDGSIAKLVRQKTATLRSSVQVRLEPPYACPGGETGRRTGLKILRTSNSVPVRFRPRAPFIDLRQQLNWIEYLSTEQGVTGSIPVQRANYINGKQHSLVVHLVWDQGVAGSNPVFPTIYWGLSSAGRAPALHAGGQEFDPPRLHQFN